MTSISACKVRVTAVDYCLAPEITLPSKLPSLVTRMSYYVLLYLRRLLPFMPSLVLRYLGDARQSSLILSCSCCRVGLTSNPLHEPVLSLRASFFIFVAPC
jgi:hypothetical protein